MWTKVPPSVVGFSTSLTLIAGLGVAKTSQAAPCTGVPNPVIVSGTPSIEPLIVPIARMLQYDDAKPMTVIWQLNTSCQSAEAVGLDKDPTKCGQGACIKGQAKFWPLTKGDPIKTCDLDANGTHVDLAISDVGHETCPTFGRVQFDLIDTRGPVSAYGLTMSRQASETAIHAEEAHFVYLRGKAAGVRPWLSDSALLLLGDADAGQLLTGPRIVVSTGQWRGVKQPNIETLLLELQRDPGAGLTILPTTINDARRGEVRTLAFQTRGQHGAFYPDRKSTTFEKMNVRDGHYPLWGYVHTILRVDPLNPTQPKSANGARLSDILLAKNLVAGKDVLPMQIAAGFVPQCAMQVSRSSDGGPLTPSPPAEPCHCYFEKTVKDGTLGIGCAECPDGLTCASGKCRRNFCEVQ